MPIDTKLRAYEAMSERWEPIDDLLGGTKLMRELGIKWLPKEPAEDPDGYKIRRDRTFLYEAYQDSIEKLVAQPFSKPVTLQGDLPEQLEPIENNADRDGTTLSLAGKAYLEDALNHGLTHVFVDFPAVPQLRQDEERAGQVYPYFTHVKATDLFWWQWERDEFGRRRLTEIRIKDVETEVVNGEEAEFNVVRVYRVEETGTVFEKWRKRKADRAWPGMPDEGPSPISYPGIPLVTYYTKRTGFLTGLPPLEKLAWLNIEHWQISSGDANNCRWAGFDMLFGSGWENYSKEEGGLQVGPSAIIIRREHDAKLGYVNHDSAGGEFLREKLERIERKMRVVGDQPLVDRTGDVTATGRAIDASKVHSTMQAWVRALEMFLRECYEVAGRWLGIEELDEEFKVDVFSEFTIGLRASEDIKALQADRQQRVITNVTYLQEAKRRGLYSETVDPEDETEEAANQDPALGMVTSDEFQSGGEDDESATANRE